MMPRCMSPDVAQMRSAGCFERCPSLRAKRKTNARTECFPRGPNPDFCDWPLDNSGYIARMKQVLVVNSALALPPGKMAARVAHASIAAFLMAGKANREKWLDVGLPKIVLDGENEARMKLLLRQAHEVGVPAYLVRDAGRTVIPEGTVTCLGIGPAAVEEIDTLTGALPLLK
jgi:peptidyl-tRNA hydrolase, PTH2 family